MTRLFVGGRSAHCVTSEVHFMKSVNYKKPVIQEQACSVTLGVNCLLGQHSSMMFFLNNYMETKPLSERNVQNLMVS